MDKEFVLLFLEIFVIGFFILLKILLLVNIVFVLCYFIIFGLGGVVYVKIYIYNWFFLLIDFFTVILVLFLFGEIEYKCNCLNFF